MQTETTLGGFAANYPTVEFIGTKQVFHSLFNIMLAIHGMLVNMFYGKDCKVAKAFQFALSQVSTSLKRVVEIIYSFEVGICPQTILPCDGILLEFICICTIVLC